jgi:hypothetical protein
MNTIELRDKLRHFFAVNQINIAEFKYLVGTIMLFISIGGLHKMFVDKLYIKKYQFFEVIYYISIASLGIIFYLKIV